MSERRLLIDGELVEAAGGATFENLNPATEEVLGVVADGTRADMERAVAAARRAFDTTTWATDRALRARCLLQLQAALEAEREELRAELVATVTDALGKSFKPSEIRFTAALPKTRSAKVLRRAIRAAAVGTDPGDLSSLEDPAALDAVREAS